MTASIARLAVDDRARFDEHLDTAVVTVVHDDIRSAAEGLKAALDERSLVTTGTRIDVAARRLLAALAEAPTAEVAECPGRLIVTRVGYWHSQLFEDAICDVCGKEVTP